MRLLAVGALQFASDEQVEFLVGAAEFDVGLERDGVVALSERIEQFVQRDGFLFHEALVEVFALEHLGDCVLGGEANEIFGGEFGEPAALKSTTVFCGSRILKTWVL